MTQQRKGHSVMYHIKWASGLYSGSYLKFVELSQFKSLENKSQDLKKRPESHPFCLEEWKSNKIQLLPFLQIWVSPPGNQMFGIRPQYKSTHEQWRGLNSSLDSNPSWHHSTDIITRHFFTLHCESLQLSCYMPSLGSLPKMRILTVGWILQWQS